MEGCLKQLQARLAFLFDALVRQLGARRAGLQKVADAPADMPSLQAATQQLCALCAALDRAPPLEFPHARLSVREWLREHLSLLTTHYSLLIIAAILTKVREWLREHLSLPTT